MGLSSNKKNYETGTSKICCIKDNKVFSPKKNYYKRITYKFFNSKIKKIIQKDILISSLEKFDEIILIGSGKGVASVKTINQINWKRKSLKYFKLLNNHYSLAIKQCAKYK